MLVRKRGTVIGVGQLQQLPLGVLAGSQGLVQLVPQFLLHVCPIGQQTGCVRTST